MAHVFFHVFRLNSLFLHWISGSREWTWFLLPIGSFEIWNTDIKDRSMGAQSIQSFEIWRSPFFFMGNAMVKPPGELSISGEIPHFSRAKSQNPHVPIISPGVSKPRTAPPLRRPRLSPPRRRRRRTWRPSWRENGGFTHQIGDFTGKNDGKWRFHWGKMERKNQGKWRFSWEKYIDLALGVTFNV